MRGLGWVHCSQSEPIQGEQCAGQDGLQGSEQTCQTSIGVETNNGMWEKDRSRNSRAFKSEQAYITRKGNLECIVMTVFLVVLIKRQ